MKKCPRCERSVHLETEECPFCGVVFAKLERSPRREQRTPRTVQTRQEPVARTWLSLGEMRRLGQFFHRMGTRLKAGQSLSRALDSWDERGTELARVVCILKREIDGGRGLMVALERAEPGWPAFVWAHLRAGEAGGRMPQMMLSLADYLEKRRAWLISQIVNLRTLYFILVCVAASFSLGVLGAVSDLDSATLATDRSTVLQAIIRGAGLRIGLWLLFFAGLAWLFVRFQLRWKYQLTERLPWVERLRLAIPVSSTILIGEAWSRYFRLLSMCLDSGLSMPVALDLAQADVDYPQWRKQLSRIREAVQEGAGLAEAFRLAPALNEESLGEIATGEETGTLPASLIRAAGFLDEKVQRARQIITTILTVFIFLIAIVLTIAVLAKGAMAPFQLMERMEL